MRFTRIAFLTLFPLALLAVLAYALWVEPARVAVVRHDLRSVGAAVAGAPWRLVQVSDLHLQGFGEREQALARQVQGLGTLGGVLEGWLGLSLEKSLAFSGTRLMQPGKSLQFD